MESSYLLQRRAISQGLAKPPEPKAPATINKKSDKLKAGEKEYKKVRKAYLTVHISCEVKGCNHVATEIHHQKGRIGDLLIDTNFFLAVCSEHHKKIELLPAWAKEKGYSISRHKK